MMRRMLLSLCCLAIAAAASAGDAHRSNTVKLVPQMRAQALTENTLSPKVQSLIKPFLKRTLVVNPDELLQAPYVVAFPKNQIAATTGQKFYARGNILPTMASYAVVKPGEPFVDPETKTILGHTAIYVATAQLITAGDPATLEVSAMAEPVVEANRLLPDNAIKLDLAFAPHPAKAAIKGKVIGILNLDNSIAQAGKFGAVVINRGAADGVEPGNTMMIYTSGETIKDPLKKGEKPITLPNEKVGELMVFKVYERVSFALVTDATPYVRVLDLVGND